MNKYIHKAIMVRSRLRKKFLKEKTVFSNVLSAVYNLCLFSSISKLSTYFENQGKPNLLRLLKIKIKNCKSNLLKI